MQNITYTLEGFTAKRIQDRSIVSSIKPKFEKQFFLGLIVFFTNCEHKIVIVLIWFAETVEQFSASQLSWTHLNRQRNSCQILYNWSNYGSVLYAFSSKKRV